MDVAGMVKIIRPLNDIMSGFAVFISGVVSAGWAMPLVSVLAASAGTFFASAGGMVINDYFDYDIDSVNKPFRPIPSGQISRTKALYFSLGLFSCAGGCALFTNWYCIIAGIPALILIILYSWKLKRTLFVGNIVVGILSGLALLFGGIATKSIHIVSVLALIAFFASVSREMAKDIEDIEGDKRGGSKSIPVVAGVERSAQISGIFLLMAIIFSFLPYTLGIFNHWYVILVIPVNIMMVFVALQMLSKKIERISLWQKIIKVGMYSTLIIFLLSRLFM
jgi:geranylgeranylglycerol-phosphate geranylgeranyltransferase